MGAKRSCRICLTGRYYSDPRKFFRDSHLCHDCSIICGLNVQHLIPADERKTTSVFPRSSKAYKINSKPLICGSLGKSDPQAQVEFIRHFDFG